MRTDIFYIENDGGIYNPDSCSPLEAAYQRGEVELCTLARGTYPGKKLKDDELPSIKSIGYWDAKFKQNWGLDFHRNEGVEICLLESGHLNFELNGRHYDLAPNHLTITRPWIPHKLGNPDISSSKLHWFIIDLGVRQPHQEWQWPDWIILKPSDLKELTDILRRNEQPVWNVDSGLKECFVAIGKTINRDDERFFDSKIKVLINEILIRLLELFSYEKPELNDSLIQSKRSVEIFLQNLESMSGENWTLKEMAQYCGLGTTQFSKYCQEVTHTTPMVFLNNIRQKKAWNLIHADTNLSLTNIAYECGFSSIQYFSQVFKRQYKMSPKECKEKITFSS